MRVDDKYLFFVNFIWDFFPSCSRPDPHWCTQRHLWMKLVTTMVGGMVGFPTSYPDDGCYPPWPSISSHWSPGQQSPSPVIQSSPQAVYSGPQFWVGEEGTTMAWLVDKVRKIRRKTVMHFMVVYIVQLTLIVRLWYVLYSHLISCWRK